MYFDPKAMAESIIKSDQWNLWKVAWKFRNK